MEPTLPALLPPGSAALLGTDGLGRPVSGLLFHASLGTAFDVGAAALLAALLGGALGALLGLLRGRLARLAGESLVTLSYAAPMLVVLLVVLSFSGDRPFVFPLVTGVFSAGAVALSVETSVRRIIAQPYVLAARAMGATPTHVFRYHIVPNTLGTVRAATLGTLGPVLQVSVLVSFLGVGGGSTRLGTLLREGYLYFPAAWWLWVTPTVVAVAMLGFTSFLAEWQAGSPASAVAAHR